MKTVRIETETGPDNKIMIREIKEKTWISTLSTIGILLSAIATFAAIYLVTENTAEQRDFEIYKLSFEEKFKTLNELVNESGKIVNYTASVRDSKKVPDSLINSLDKIYNSKLQLFYPENNSIRIITQQFKYAAQEWRMPQTPTKIKQIQENLINELSGELNIKRNE